MTKKPHPPPEIHVHKEALVIFINKDIKERSDQMKPEKGCGVCGKPSDRRKLAMACEGCLDPLCEECASKYNHQSGGSITPGTGTLYAALQRMHADGLIADSDVGPGPDEDQRRRYYAITDFGRETARAEVRRLIRVLDVAEERALVPHTGAGGE